MSSHEEKNILNIQISPKLPYTHAQQCKQLILVFIPYRETLCCNVTTIEKASSLRLGILRLGAEEALLVIAADFTGHLRLHVRM